MTVYGVADPVSHYCTDCSSGSIAVLWFDGPRCQKCSDKWKAQIQAKRKAEWEAEQAAIQAHIEDGCQDDGIFCEQCCEHEELDCGHCLDCGKDCAEDLMAAAYDRAKAMKYGD